MALVSVERLVEVGGDRAALVVGGSEPIRLRARLVTS
jgi:hypothetical protein